MIIIRVFINLELSGMKQVIVALYIEEGIVTDTLLTCLPTFCLEIVYLCRVDLDPDDSGSIYHDKVINYILNFPSLHWVKYLLLFIKCHLSFKVIYSNLNLFIFLFKCTYDVLCAC